MREFMNAHIVSGGGIIEPIEEPWLGQNHCTTQLPNADHATHVLIGPSGGLIILSEGAGVDEHLA